MTSNQLAQLPSKQQTYSLETNQTQNKSDRHFGCMLVVAWKENGQPKWMLGPDYIVFLCTLVITSIIMIVLSASIIFSAAQKQLQITGILVFSTFFFIYSYTKVGFSNPGIGSTHIEPDQQTKSHHRYCTPCKSIREFGTIHCYSCDICIKGYDHHCPWVGKCIGSQNLCAFKMFLLSVITAIASLGVCAGLGAPNQPIK